MKREYSLTPGRQAWKEPAYKKAAHIALDALLGITALLVVYSIISTVFYNKENAFLFGYKPYIISSESMGREYMKNGVVLIKSGGYDDVKAGDLIAFKAERIGGRPAFHRVIEVTDGGFITKGDSNEITDTQIVDRGSFIGREVSHTNITAWLAALTQAPHGLLTMVAVPVSLVAATVVFMKLLGKIWKRRGGKRDGASAF